MTKSTLAFAVSLAGILALPVKSFAEEFHPGKFHPYGTLDFFLPANSGDGLWEDTQTGMRQLSGLGYSTVGSIDNKGAIGGRIGALVQVTPAFDVGFSGGYIAGPNAEAKITATNGATSAVLVDKRKVSFTRFLVEPTLNVKINEKAFFHLGAGLGVAHGRTEETYTCTGNACTTQGTIGSDSSSWTGFTWEVSPYFSADYFIAGIRYAGFPKFKGNANNSKMEWTSLGFFAGAKF